MPLPALIGTIPGDGQSRAGQPGQRRVASASGLTGPAAPCPVSPPHRSSAAGVKRHWKL